MFKFTSILVVTACWFSLAVLPLHAGNIVGDPSFEAGGASCNGASGNHCPGHVPWIFTPGATRRSGSTAVRVSPLLVVARKPPTSGA